MSKKYTFYLEITTSCNFACPFCPSSKKETHYNMNKNDAIKFIDEIKDYCELLYFHVLGEPFLHPNFIEILDYVEDNKIPFGITTNGLLIKDYARIIFKYNYLKKINISLQSLIQLGYKDIETYLISLEEVINIRNNLNSKTPINLRLWNNKEQDEVKLLNMYIENRIKFLIDNDINIRISYDNEFIWPDLEHSNNLLNTTCLGGKKQFAILHDGTLALCCLDYQGKTSLGNLLNQSFSKIIDSPLYKQFLQSNNNNKPYFELCKKCTFRNKFK